MNSPQPLEVPGNVATATEQLLLRSGSAVVACTQALVGANGKPCWKLATWNSNEPCQQRVEHVFERVKSAADTSQLNLVFEQMYQECSHLADYFGLDIYQAVQQGRHDIQVDRMDMRYLSLIHLLASHDLPLAVKFHEMAQELYRNQGNSYVRYSRIGISLDRSTELLHDLHNRGSSLVSTIPKFDSTFAQEEFPLAQGKAALLGNSAERENQLLSLSLPEPCRRDRITLSSQDHHETARSQWITDIDDHVIRKVRFYHLNNARICNGPTGITFEENGMRRYVHSMTDIYHYTRTTGVSALNPVERHMSAAYILPRYGLNNYYHSLVDKLPALYGYKLLGLSCPIVSTYELNGTELAIARLLGIDTDTIVIDQNASVLMEAGILPNVAELRVLFFQYCSSLNTRERLLGKNIYITRHQSPDRVMENEEQVHDLVKSHGFEIVAMEQYSLDEQIAIAAHAQCIVAPHGAGLANMVFAPKQCAIVELIPDKYMTPLFFQLATDCGHPYSIVMGKVTSDVDADSTNLGWNADLETLEAVLTDVTIH